MFLFLPGCACDMRNTILITPDNPIHEDSKVICEDSKYVVYEEPKTQKVKKMDERRKDYGIMSADIDEIKLDVRKIKETLLGNGSVGLLEQVRANTTYISHQKQIGFIALKTIIVFIILTLLGILAFKIGIPKW